MAAIDKLYGNRQEFYELKAWCTQHIPNALAYFYEWDEKHETQALTNFPQYIDLFLLNNCPIQWATDQIRNQYDLEHGGSMPEDNHHEWDNWWVCSCGMDNDTSRCIMCGTSRAQETTP